MVENRFIDIPAEPADMVIRVGPLADSDLIARRLLVSETWLCTSPGYLARRGMPVCAADLTGHTLIGYGDRAVAYRDDAPGEGGRIDLPPNAAVSDSAALLPVVLAGAGIAHLPDFLALQLVTDGRLVRLWPAAQGDEIAIHALYPSHRSLSAKVRVFIDTLVASCDGHHR